MSLRKKTLFIVGMILSCLMVVSFVVSSLILKRGFAEVEVRDVRQKVQRLKDAISYEISNLSSQVNDWAVWDEAYSFMEDGDPAFVDRNLPVTTYSELRLNLVLFMNTDGEIVFARCFDLQEKRAVPVPQGVLDHIAAVEFRTHHMDPEKSARAGTAGLTLLPEGPMFIASRTILTSEGEGPAHGLLVMGRNFDENQVELLSSLTHLKFNICPSGGADLPGGTEIPPTVPTEEPIQVRPLSEDLIAGHTLLRDAYGKPALLLSTDIPRTIHRLGETSMHYLMVSVLVISIVFLFLALLLLERLVLSRLFRLDRSVNEIAAGADLSMRVPWNGSDELSSLASNINKMLTALEASQRERHEALLRFESVIQNAPLVAIQGFDRDGVICHWNDASARLYGIAPSEAIGLSIHQVSNSSIGPGLLQGRVRQVWESRRSLPPTEMKLRTRDGSSRWVYSSLWPVVENGSVAEVFHMEVDITDRKQTEDRIAAVNQELESMNARLEAALAHAKDLALQARAANIAKSEFLARMSHEIRTPMNGLIGFTEILLDTHLTEEQTDYVNTVQRNGESLLALINDILNFSKIEAGQMDLESIDFDPEVVAYDACELVLPKIKDKPIESLCRVADNVPASIKGDPTRFRQVLVNLMGNAVKFTESGEIELCMNVEEEDGDRIQVHVTVRDTGIGIAKDKLGVIFEAFQQADSFTTRKYGGSGLGLAICRQLAKLMEGNVWAESTVGNGATFHFTAWFQKSKKAVKFTSPASLAGKRVLIVDDNQTNRDILRHTLGRAGMFVRDLARGQDVLPVLREAHDRGHPFDLCILDIVMPGVNGFEAAKLVRSDGSPIARTPLLAFSSSTDQGVRKCAEAGFDAFLLKPTPRPRLFRTLTRLLGETQDEPQGERKDTLPQRAPIKGANRFIKVLLAEDNAANLKLATVLLTKVGCEVEPARDGREAIEKFTSAPLDFDLIFMDVQMPVLDGLEATRIIRNKGFYGIPIVAMTANAMDGDREKCIVAGMNDYVPKPIRRETVLEVIRKIVQKGSTQE